jgi:hypothetical protein
MKNLVGHVSKSLSNHDIEEKGGHHHMYVITCTNRNEDCQERSKYPIICKILERNEKQHMMLTRRS